MKARLLVCGLVLLSAYVNGQNKTLGVGVDTPNPNAALHVESPGSNQGFIMPRLTTAQRTGMATLLTATDNGLMLYDTDEKILYIWDGAAWKSSQQVAQANLALAANKLTLPYADVNTNAPNGSALIDLSSNPANAADVVSVAQFSNQNAGAFSNVLKLNNSGTGAIMIATSSGGGSGGVFQTTNATNGFPALRSSTTGTGNALRAQINNTASTADAFFGTTNGTGTVIRANHNGTAGYAGVFQNINAANNTPSLFASTASNGPAFRADTDQGGNAIEGSIFGTGTGSAGNFTISNAANSSPALFATTSGTGNAITAVGKIQATQFIGDGSALTGVTVGANSIATGQIIDGTISDADINSAAALSGTKINPNFGAQNIATTGRSFAGKTVTKTLGADTLNYAEINNPASIYPAILAVSNSDGGAGAFLSTNTSTGSSGLYVEARGNGPALDVLTTGTTTGARFIINNGANNDPILQGTTIGTGSGIELNLNTASASPGILINKSGGIGNAITADRPIQATQFIGDGSLLTGISGGLTLPFTSSNADASSAFTINNTSTTGSAASFNVNNASATSAGVVVTTNGGSTLSTALRAETTGGGYAGEFNVNNTTNARAAVRASTNANSGPAIQAVTSGGNSIATFQNTNAINAATAVDVSTNGTGRGLRVTSSNTANGQPAFDVSQAGTGSGASIANSNTSGSALTLNLSNAGSTAAALNITHAGTGNAITANRPIQATTITATGNVNANGLSYTWPGAQASGVLTNNGSGGLTWATAPGLVLPYSNSISSGSSAFYIANTGTGGGLYSSAQGTSGSAGIFTITDVTNGSPALQVGSGGTGIVFSSSANGSSGQAGRFHISGTTNSSIGLESLTGGTGSAGAFTINNTANNASVLSANTNGNGSAATFTITQGTNTAPAINISHAGSGNAITANRPIQATAFIGDGSALTGLPGLTLPYSGSNGAASTTFDVTATGSAGAGYFKINNAASAFNALIGETNGGAAAIRANVTGTGTANAGRFEVTNASNNNNAVLINHAGTGSAISANREVTVSNNSTSGGAGTYTIANASNTNVALSASTNGTGRALTALTTGTSQAAQLQISNASNTQTALDVITNGTGGGLNLTLSSGTNTSPAINITHSGTGNAITANRTIQATGLTATGSGLNVNGLNYTWPGAQASGVLTNNGSGGLSWAAGGLTLPFSGSASSTSTSLDISNSSASGKAGSFSIVNPANDQPSLSVSSNAPSPSLEVSNSGGAEAAVFSTPNGSGANTVNFFQDGDGYGALFSINKSTSPSEAIYATTVGLGTVATFNNFNGTNTQAVIRINNSNGTNGLALEIQGGGLRYNVTNVASAGAIATRSNVYNVTVTGTFTLSWTPTVGDAIYVFNSNGSSITFAGLSINANTLARMIYIGGAWRVNQ